MSNKQLQNVMQVAEGKQHVAVSAAYTVKNYERFIQCVASSSYTVTIPSAAAVPLGTEIAVFVATDSISTYTITIAEATVGADALSATLSTTTVAAIFKSLGSQWAQVL